MPDLKTAKPTDLLGAPMVPTRSWFFGIDDLVMPDGELWDPINQDHPLVWVGTEDGPNLGRCAMLVAPGDACILDGRERKGRCLTPPKEPADYDFAHIGDTEVDSGLPVRTARIAGSIDHAGEGPVGAAQDYYANTGFGFARVRYFYEPQRGGTFAAGALDPLVTVWGSLMLRASSLSGDWRWVEELEGMRLAGSQAVNVPGFRPTVDRAPTRASLRYVLAALGDSDRLVSLWTAGDDEEVERMVASITAANKDGSAPKNPEFEAKITRSGDGKFGSKSGTQADEAIARVNDALKSGKIKPATKAPAKKKAAKKKAGGKGGAPKPSEDEKAAEAARKKRLKVHDVANEIAGKVKEITDALGDKEAGSIVDLLTEGASDLGKPGSDGSEAAGAISAFGKAYDDTDALITKLAESTDPGDQEKTAKLRRVREAIASQISNLGGDRPTSKTEAAKRAKSNADRVTRQTEAAKKADERAKAKADRQAEAARKKAERDAAKAAKDAAKTTKTKTTAAMTVIQEEPTMSNTTDCGCTKPIVIAGMELVDSPAFSYGQEVTDADGTAWIVTEATYELSDGTPAVGLVTFAEVDTYPRVVTVKPADELTATGRIMQWKADPATDAPATAASAAPVEDPAGDDTPVEGAAGDAAPADTTDLAATVEELRSENATLTSRLDAIEAVVARMQEKDLTAVDLADAADPADAAA